MSVCVRSAVEESGVASGFRTMSIIIIFSNEASPPRVLFKTRYSMCVSTLARKMGACKLFNRINADIVRLRTYFCSNC